jgi:M6 family metalloprotease-like protein
VNAFVNNLTTTSHVSYTGIYLDYDDGSYDLQLTMPSDLSLVDSEHTSDMSIDYNHSATNNTAITLQTSWFTYQGVDVVSVDASTIYASTSSEEFRIGTSSNNGFVRFNFAAATNITSIELFGRRWASDATTVVAKTSGFTSSAVTWGTKTSHIYTLDDATATYLEISATKRFLFESIRITFGTEVHVPVTNVAFELISLTLGVNATKQLGWTVFPSNATDQGVSFMSLDSTIAAVNATGLITASNVGTTSIIVTTNEGGFTDTIDITVVASSVTGVSFALTELEVSVGADGYLAYTVMPEEAVNKTVTMTSDNPDVFDVDDDGFYLAFDAGEATVTVRTVEGGYTDTIAITVIPAVQSGYYQANNLSSLTNTFISKNSAYAQGRSGSGQGLDPVLPSRGDAKMLIIPVDFANYRISDPTTFRSNLNKLFFGTPSETGWESVKSFYETSSYGKLTMSGLVTPVWSLTQRTSDIVDLDDIQYNYSLVGAGEKTTDDLIYEVSGFLTAQGIDGRDYDVDQDGHLDSVWFIYSCPIQYQNNGAFWAYVFSSNNPSRLTTPSLSKPTGWRYAWASYDFMFEGNYSGNKVDAHTFIHETGHLMGVEDYYDYSSQGVDYVACADMMSYNIGDHNVFTKFQLGWVNPYVIDGTKTSTTITLESTPSSGDCILIKNTTGGNYWNNSPYDEYLLLEFYTPTLLNQADSQGYAGRPGLKTYTTSGIKLYHVDARVYGWLGSGYGFTDTAVDGGSYYLAMSNTYNGTISSSSHPLLELIPQNKTTAFRNGSYTNSNVGSSALLFTNGTSFSVDTYQNFFLSRKLYDGTTLGYSFTVNAINGNNTATVVISKV